MNLIIQKYGGTSVSTYENRKKVIKKILRTKNETNKVIVVVSAIGRNGDPYATDTLKNLVDKDFIDNKNIDLLISCGEIISSIILSNEINKSGYKSVVLTGKDIGIITDNDFGNSNIIDFDRTNLENALNDSDIVVIAGFQGATINGDITTLGRGGSDISAAIIGGYMNAHHVEIYTDVDGIMTADPRIVKDAKVINKMCYSEVSQLAEDGAKVIHPKAVDIAQQFDIPIIIKNTYTDSLGTYIEDININNINRKIKISDDKIMTAITYKKNRIQVSLELKDELLMNKVMRAFVNYKISLDLISFFKDKKIFTIDSLDKKNCIKILDSFNIKYHMITDCCKISCIGYKMRGQPGVMSNIFEALTINKIDVLQTSDSHNTIWCLIKESDLDKALKALHTRFKLYE